MRRSFGFADPAGTVELPPHHRRGCVVHERGDGCGGCLTEAHHESRKREHYARLHENDVRFTGYGTPARRR